MCRQRVVTTGCHQAGPALEHTGRRINFQRPGSPATGQTQRFKIHRSLRRHPVRNSEHLQCLGQFPEARQRSSKFPHLSGQGTSNPHVRGKIFSKSDGSGTRDLQGAKRRHAVRHRSPFRRLDLGTAPHQWAPDIANLSRRCVAHTVLPSEKLIPNAELKRLQVEE